MRFKSRTRAMAVAALAASVSLAGLTTVASPAGAAPAETDRIAGTTRYGTAAEVATRAFPTGADTVVVTTGEKIPDALSANPIAGANDAPILLVQQSAVPAETQAAMTELDPSNVIIVGGTEAVSAAVEAAIEAQGATVTREAGDDRFATAAEVARAVGDAPAVDADGAGSQTAMPTVALANGLTGLADAVSASPMLHQEEVPLLLTSGNTLNADAAAAIDELGATQVLVLGGTAVIPASVIDELEEMGLNVEVLAGGTRFETATAIADFEVDFLGFDAARTFLASGFSLVDALAGGPVASVENGPIVLVTETDVPAGTAAWITENAADIDEVVAIGGTAVINDSVLTEASELADEAEGAASATIRPELLSAEIVQTVTPGNATPSRPAGTYVRYTFDEAIALGATAGNFKVYYANGTLAEVGDSASIDAGALSVTVRFGDQDTAAEAGALSVATVVVGAVTDAAGNTNPEGDAAIGSGGQSTVTAGVTAAPDVTGIAAYRQGNTVGTTAVDFTFDEAATVLNTTGFSLVLTDNTVRSCTSSTTPASGAPSGGTVPGGSGTTTITVVCSNPDTTVANPGGTPLSAANVARGVVALGTVQDASTPAVANPLETADSGNSGNTAGPDLVSGTFVQGTVDSALYVFDANITTTGVASLFNAYLSNGTQIEGQTVSVSATDPRQVLVTFAGSTALDSAVGISVDPGAVTAGALGANQADEVGVANTTASTITPGSTAAPDLTGVSVTAATGFTPASATYTFDQNVEPGDPAIIDGLFHLYTSSGVRLTATTCNRGTTLSAIDADSEAPSAAVTCAFGTVDNAAANANVINAVLGTVEAGAVDDDTNTALTNPEGAALTTGGTGTPAT